MAKKNIVIILIIILALTSSIFLYFYSNKSSFDEKTSVKLYKSLIDKYISSSIKLNNTYDYFFIDISTLNNLSDNKNLSKKSIDEILLYCQKYDKYNPLERKEDLIIKKIYFDVVKINKNTVSINLNYNIKNSKSTGGINYICKYTKGNWEISNEKSAWAS